MKLVINYLRLLCFWISLWLLFPLISQAQSKNSTSKQNQANTPEQVLQLLLNKLNSVNSIKYDYRRNVNYVSEKYQNELLGTTYIDFRSADTLIGFHFQFLSTQSKVIYGGENLLSMQEEEKKMIVNKQPKINDFTSFSFFYNSLITLKNSLNTIIPNKEIHKTLADTNMNGKHYYAINLKLNSMVIKNLGSISNLSTQRYITYKVIIDKATCLPFQIIQTNSVELNDYVLTTFSNYEINSYSPAEVTWLYINYVNDYKPTFRN